MMHLTYEEVQRHTGWTAFLPCLEVTGSPQSVAVAMSCTTKTVLQQTYILYIYECVCGAHVFVHNICVGIRALV